MSNTQALSTAHSPSKLRSIPEVMTAITVRRGDPYDATPWQQLSQSSPVMHALMPTVSQSMVADVLTALGVRVSMTQDVDAMASMTLNARSLVVNLGMPTPSRRLATNEVLRLWDERGWLPPDAGSNSTLETSTLGTQGEIQGEIQGRGDVQMLRPWVLDPVKVDMDPERLAWACACLRQRPTIVRGNRAEIVALAAALPEIGSEGGFASLRAENFNAIAPSPAHDHTLYRSLQRIALVTGGVVVATGEADHIAIGRHQSVKIMQSKIGQRLQQVPSSGAWRSLKSLLGDLAGEGSDGSDGSDRSATIITLTSDAVTPWLKQTVTTGCALTAVMAALCTVTDAVTAALTALIGARHAAWKAETWARGPVSFKMYWADALASLASTASDSTDWTATPHNTQNNT